MNRILMSILIAGVVIAVCDACYGFRIAGYQASLDMRAEIERPRILAYVTGMLTGAALPFALASFLIDRRWLFSALSTLIILSFFPMLLNKTVLFAPVWCVFLFVLFQRLDPKTATLLSFTITAILGIAMEVTHAPLGFYIVRIVNLRMIATPSSVLDHYFAFFSFHPLTHFCQINIIKVLAGCPYSGELGVILKSIYDLGNMNGSLFTTEGVASVGPAAMPLVTFICGLIISLGNVRISPALMAASSGVLVQTLLNVPLSIAMVTGGGALLFLLWHIAEDRPAQA